jgi:hypothetical protein
VRTWPTNYVKPEVSVNKPLPQVGQRAETGSSERKKMGKPTPPFKCDNPSAFLGELRTQDNKTASRPVQDKPLEVTTIRSPVDIPRNTSRFPRLDEMTPAIRVSPMPKDSDFPEKAFPGEVMRKLELDQMHKSQENNALPHLTVSPNPPANGVQQRRTLNAARQQPKTLGKQIPAIVPPVRRHRLHTKAQAHNKVVEERVVQSSSGMSVISDLPFTWRFTVRNSSSLERALEAVTRELEKEEVNLGENEPLHRASVNSKGEAEKSLSRSLSYHISVSRQVDLAKPNDSDNKGKAATLASRSTQTSPVSLDYDDRDISDRDVLRGLHIIVSAACDEEVDAFIRHKTGVRIRRFCADLKAFESLGREEEKRADQDQRARKRRAQKREFKKLKQQMRSSRHFVNTRPSD